MATEKDVRIAFIVILTQLLLLVNCDECFVVEESLAKRRQAGYHRMQHKVQVHTACDAVRGSISAPTQNRQRLVNQSRCTSPSPPK